ncbi:unnamed protein product [Hymenolepis diminuta]|uniref:Uncharacterized protein n=1 Tax=Hymenolepis diminuta TaxID=6216 RepID=A0A564YWP5_HYMDI|nr:unnamed protein product [Hymenolepis diminuta]
MVESLSAEIRVLSAKFESRMSPDVSNASTVSLNFSKNSTQSAVLLISRKASPNATISGG